MSLVLTTEQAAALLCCSKRRVFQLIADGTLAAAPRYGKETTVFRASVERALLNPPRVGRPRRQRRNTGEIPKSDRSALII